MNTQVNFQIALLLDEKNYGEYELTRYYYQREDYFYKDKLLSKKGKLFYNEDYPYNHYKGQLNAPTVAAVVMWLYEKYGVWIAIQPTSNVGKFQFRTYWNNNNVMNQRWNNSMNKEFNSPTKAYEAAITYTLKKLIQKTN